jgi:phosphoketolase
MKSVLAKKEWALIDAYWRAANYLSVGQIYLYDNPLLRKPLTRAHIKPRLLGHWGTTPGLNVIYVHLNRLIKEQDLNMIYITGPGHGGPGIVANTYLEGTYSEVYSNISQDERGMKRLFKQFSFPRDMGLPMSRFIVNIDRYGNTSAASIPLALAEGLENGRIQPGDTGIFVSFGAGLTWGAMVVQLNPDGFGG